MLIPNPNDARAEKLGKISYDVINMAAEQFQLVRFNLT